ncbi:unnamed protein product, partial [Ectocarpus sp. 12 AP-2014]
MLSLVHVLLGPFSYEHRETAPPWSVGWLPTSPTMAEQHTDDAFSRPREMLFGDHAHTDQQKKKLFVGMAPKSAYEEDYRAVFEPFGTPIDIYVIRDRNGFSKGCAFVRYESVRSASDAIEALHDKHIMPGGFRTLVVTVADDRRGPQTSAVGTTTTRRDAVGSGDGLLRSLSRPSSFMGSDSGVGGSIPSLGNLVEQNRSTVAAPQAGATAVAPTVAPGSGPSSGLLSGMPYFLCGGNPPQGTYVYYPYVPSSSVQHDTGSSAAPVGIGAKPHHAFAVGSTAVGNNDRCELGARGAQEDGYTGDRTVRKFGTGGPEERGRRWAKQSVGPTGANLFVYYLPGSLTDADLATAFAPFGEVLSAKVYYDRDTGESKGFGFVSYSKPDEAEAAISSMNGFFIGQKRLKVVRKRGQQTDRCLDSSSSSSSNNNNNNSGRPRDPGYPAGDDSCGLARPNSGASGNAGTNVVVGSRMNNDNEDSTSHRSILGSGSQADLEFFTPEGLLGPSMTR